MSEIQLTPPEPPPPLGGAAERVRKAHGHLSESAPDAWTSAR